MRHVCMTQSSHVLDNRTAITLELDPIMISLKWTTFIFVAVSGRGDFDDDDDCFYIALFSVLEQTHCARM